MHLVMCWFSCASSIPLLATSDWTKLPASKRELKRLFSFSSLLISWLAGLCNVLDWMEFWSTSPSSSLPEGMSSSQ